MDNNKCYYNTNEFQTFRVPMVNTPLLIQILQYTIFELNIICSNIKYKLPI